MFVKDGNNTLVYRLGYVYVLEALAISSISQAYVATRCEFLALAISVSNFQTTKSVS